MFGSCAETVRTLLGHGLHREMLLLGSGGKKVRHGPWSLLHPSSLSTVLSDLWLCPRRAQGTAEIRSEPCAEAGTGRAAGKRLEGASVGSPHSRWEPRVRAGMSGLGLVAEQCFSVRLGRQSLASF